MPTNTKAILLFPDGDWWYVLPDGSLYLSKMYSCTKARHILDTTLSNYVIEHVPAEWDEADIENFAVDSALAHSY